MSLLYRLRHHHCHLFMTDILCLKPFQTIAEIYESDVAEIDKAILHYEKAADYFRVRFWPYINS